MFKKLALAIAALGLAGAAYAASPFDGYPLVGDTSGTSACLSYGNGGVCNQYRPAGPAILNGSEQLPAANPNGPQSQQTILIPSNLLANGYGDAAVLTTTGTTALVQVADGVNTQIYAGAGTATYTSFKLPANPIDNQKLCLVNSGSGVLTLTAVAASANQYGNTPTVTGVTPTSVPVMTAVGTAGTVTLGVNCWLYVAGASNNGVWYRVL